MADSKLLNPSGSASPPPNCAICLGSCSNKCFSDTCMHQFCFKCLLQWSKIKAECPLCKQPFKSIIHNVKSNEEYEEHIVEEPRPIHIIDNEQFLYLPQSPPNPSRHQHRFHFRTTFTVNTHGENAIQQMLLSHSLTNGISISNYLPGSWPQYNRRTRRDISTTTSYRRSIYNNNFWASAPMNVSVDGRFREVTPEYFQANPASRTRLAPWLNRELNALLHENTQDVMQLVDTIMDYLLRYHICSRSFRNLLQTYLGDRTDHFVHEFYNFMRSPFDMIGYDRHVVYVERPTSPPLLIDNSEDDNSDVIIVEENPVVIEVSSTDSDVIMTSLPGEIPKPQILPSFRRSHKRSRHIESSSSSSSDREQKRREERSKRHKRKKISREEKHKKSRPFKLADFVMDDSSSSELDDLPLAKYIRIKASIGKKILKKSSHLAERKINNKKSKSHQSNLTNKDRSSSRKGKLNMPKLIDLPSASSTKPHCSKYTSRRRDSSCSSVSSSSSSSSKKSGQSRNTLKNTSGSSSTFTPSSTPPLLTLAKDKKRKINHPQSPNRSSPISTTLIEGNRNEKSLTNINLKHRSSSKRERRTYEIDNNLSFRHQDLSGSGGPSVSGVKDKSEQKSLKRVVEPLKLRIKSRVCNNNDQDSDLEKPLELINHCRYSPLQVNPYVSIEQDRVVSPILLTINPNLSRNPVNVSQSINFYNSSQSPDLIDLSISKMKTENVLSDPYMSVGNHTSQHSNSSQLIIPPKESHLSGRHEPDQIRPSTSTSHQGTSQINYSHSFVPKSEPVLPDYNVDSSNRYWTDVASQNSVLANSNDPLPYNYFSQHPRKSVIQNWSNNRDYFISYNDTVSPRWSSSNSPPPYACNTECWSESSD